MKKTISFLMPLALLLVSAATVAAQNTDPMPGFRNPTSFSSAGSGAAFRGWSARVGERCYTSGNVNDTTDGYTIKSTCSSPNSPAIIGHNNITSSSYYSGMDNFTCSNTSGMWDHNDKRFQIISSTNSGLIGYTVNPAQPTVGMQRIPAGFTSSIRLGDLFTTGSAQNGNCNYSASSPNKGSEALFYTFQVLPSNALIFIDYAVVARKYDHTAYDAGEFCIRVVAQNDDGTWPTVPINDDLWYKVSAPHYSGSLPAPWVDGLPGPDYGGYTCGFCYKPWAKVAISLTQFLYQTVRIEMYTSDCNWNVDPLMAYIVGDYQPMVLRSSGCPAAESDVVDTLSAPEGMLTYAWYVATRGAVPDSYILNSSYMDTVAFRQVWPVIGTNDTINTYASRIGDFVLTEGPNAGDTVDKQTFMCLMTSAMNPTRPFESRIYANVNNRKPLVDYGYERHCDTSITFTNGSIIYVADGQQDDSTHWVFYSDTLGLNPIDTVYGNVINHKFPDEGYYGVKLFVTTDGDPCTAAKLFTVRAIGTPPADFTLSKHRLCESDVLHMQATAAVTQVPDLSYRWVVDNDTLSATGIEATTTLPVGTHIISLTTTTPEGCSFTTYDSVTVFGQPSIDLSSEVSAICLGDSVTLSAAGSVDYTWNSAPYDSTLAAVQGQTTFTVHPTMTTTYYLLPSTDNPCSIEGAEVRIEVIPYPTPTIYSSSPRVNIENSTLSFQDVSPYTASSHWQFSDGTSAEGPRVIHSFGDLTGDSVYVSLHTCNRLNCCSDTTIALPIEVTTVWFPNTFIPDNNDENSYFGMHTGLTMLTYEISIYNRSGVLVHSSDDPADRWDGTIDATGAPAPQGAYAWFCRYSYSPNATYTAKGTVTLIR